MTSADRTLVSLANTRFAERMGQFSADGRWVVYETNESDRTEIVTQAFPASRGTVPVSISGGTAPRWRAGGKEVYLAVPVNNLALDEALASPITLVFNWKP